MANLETRAQINVRLHPSELRKLQKKAKADGYEKFAQWVKAVLWKKAGIKTDPHDGRPKANRDRHK